MALAPLLWLGMVAVAVLPLPGGRRARRFSRWSPARLVTAIVVGQIGAHLVLVQAPWILGLADGHHHPTAITPVAAAVHVVAGLLLAALVRWGERWALRAAETVIAFFRSVPARRRRPSPVLHPWSPLVPSCARIGAHRTRGPPRPVLLTA
jgi:hypothetical protein